jgi:hypothetical protein
LIVIRDVGLFADFIPPLNQIEALFAGDHDGEVFEELFIELVGV